MKLENLALDIQVINSALQESASKAINKHVTSRNWLIGYSIVHYEQNGEDRAKYGEHILHNLAERLSDASLSERNLRLFRLFYQTFPQLGEPVKQFLNQETIIWQSPVAKLQTSDNPKDAILQLPVAKSQDNEYEVPASELFASMSYTHLVQLIPIKEPLERAFYEVECIKGVWSTTELKRQIGSNLFGCLSLKKVDSQNRVNNEE
jgi:hypothetical protein